MRRCVRYGRVRTKAGRIERRCMQYAEVAPTPQPKFKKICTQVRQMSRRAVDGSAIRWDKCVKMERVPWFSPGIFTFKYSCARYAQTRAGRRCIVRQRKAVRV